MKYLSSWGGLVLLALFFLAFNVLTGTALRSSRADLTEKKLYTLSQGSKNILAGLKDEITLRYYFSRKLADEAKATNVTTFANRVEEFLEEYVAHGKGKIKLTVADPEPYSETEDLAVAAGLRGAPVASGQLYFGLVGKNMLAGEETFEFLGLFDQQTREFRDEFLEYSITRLITTLANPKKKVVGILTALPMDENPMARMQNPRAPAQAWAIVDQLRSSNIDVRTLPTTTDTFAPDLDLLMIVHPQKLPEATLYAIDQFVLGGGKALVFVDPHFFLQEVPENPQNPLDSMTADRGSSMDVLFAAWGIEMPADDVAADKEIAIRQVNSKQTDYVDWVFYLGFNKEKGCFDADDATTKELEEIHCLATGVLKKKDGATTTVTPILSTTKSSMKLKKSSVQFRTPPEELLESFQSSNEPLMVGARVTGNVKTAFPNGKPKAQAEAPPPAAPEAAGLTESKSPINVVVIADVDMLQDQLWVRVQNLIGQRIQIPVADNGKFVLNLVDNLSGSNDLISVRSRGKSSRPFDKVVELRRQAEAQNRRKETDLEKALNDAQKKIDELTTNKDAKGALIISPEIQKEIEQYGEVRDQTRKSLRQVKLDLRKDIEKLKSELFRTNTFLVPILVALAGFAVLWARVRKMNEARAQASGRS